MPEIKDTVISRGDPAEPKGPVNAKERLYEKLRMPIRTLDTIIAVLIVALVAALIIGVIKGNA